MRRNRKILVRDCDVLQPENLVASDAVLCGDLLANFLGMFGHKAIVLIR